MSLSRAQKLASIDLTQTNKLVGSNGHNKFGKPFPYIGEFFTDWKVTGPPNREYVKNQWRTFMPVICKCNNIGKVVPAQLRSGHSKRCEKCRLLMTPKLMLKNRK
jgi:hypothetical protein